MTKRIAITRAEPEAQTTAQRVKEMGGVPLVAPMTVIQPKAFDTNTNGVQAILFTSTNGVRAFAAASPARDVSIITVGNATSDAALAAGFKHVRSANGDVGALAEIAGKVLQPNRGKVLHISGEHTAGDLAGMLKQVGFDAERRIAFEAHMASHWPDVLNAPFDVALFHSLRALEAFIALGAPRIGELTAVCLGPRISDFAQQWRWKKVVVAPAPREEALLAAAFAA